jgi:hypothetical protein
MKKITFLVLAMAVSLFSIAQRVTDLPLIQPDVKTPEVFKAQTHHALQNRVVGDTLWSDDFSDPSNWKMYSGAGSAYSGHWVIQNTDNDAFGYNTGTIHSTTWKNGYAAFDADANGSDGMDTSDEYIEYTKPIDCSSLESVAIVGQQFGRKWQMTHVFIEVSKDSANWTAFELETNLSLSAIMSDTIFMVNISKAAAGEDSVYLRFHYKGGWDYGWCFDDLAVVEGAVNDIALLPVLYK